MTETAVATSAAPRLKRALTLWDLVIYGIVVVAGGMAASSGGM